jgi:transposase
LVEGAVKITYSRVFARLRNEVFYTLEDLNIAIKEKLEEHNHRCFQRLKISRWQLFNKIERDVLTQLPAERYERKTFLRKKVQFNYHIELREDKHYYSVPFRYCGSDVMIIYTDTQVEIYNKNKNNLSNRIASYRRNREPNGYTTMSEHMPSNHRFVNGWNPERFIRWAEQIGDNVKYVIEKMMMKKRHPEQAFKVCMGIMSLAKKYGSNELDTACKQAIYFNYYSYKWLHNHLKNKMSVIENTIPLFQDLPEHENIRGQNYFSDGGNIK